MSSKLHILGLTVILAALSIGPARANVIYSYTGNNFTFHTSPYTASDHVTVELEFLTALAPNLPFGPVAPVSFSIDDGHQAITSTAFGGLFLLSTNAVGAISEWDVEGCANAGCVQTVITRNIVGNVRDVGQLIPQGVSEGIVDNNPGVWTSAVVPEPSTLLLFFAAVSLLLTTKLRWRRL